jgi:hypothetical protein
LHNRVAAVSTPSSEHPFIPDGVSANIWLGFEGRVRQRRFGVLIDSIDKALARGDLDAAALALDEAESLQPHAPQLAGVRATLARLSTPQPPARAWRRPLSAILLPMIGMLLLTFADWLRRPEPPSALVGPPTTHVGLPLTVAPSLVVQSPEPSPVVSPQPRRVPASTATMGDRVPKAISTALFTSTSLIGAERGASATVTPRPDAPRLDSPRPSVPQPPAPALAAPAAATAATASPPASNEPVADAAPRPEPLAPLPAAAPADTSAAESLDRRDVTATLNAYAHAFARLDARAARAVWPSVDERALARAFAGLSAQDIAFDDCAINVHGSRADAACRGTASYVAKVGKDEPRVEPRTWQFQLERDGDAWKIAAAEARRP